MDDWKLPWEGGCRCDRVRLRVTEAPLMTMACHCNGCQRMSASAFSLTMIVPASGFAVTEGDVVVGGIHGADGQHMFCDHCKTWMFTRVTAMPELVNLRPTMLDSHAWVAPYAETFTKNRLPWARTGAVKSFEEFPPMEQYQSLIQEFAKAGGRP